MRMNKQFFYIFYNLLMQLVFLASLLIYATLQENFLHFLHLGSVSMGYAVFPAPNAAPEMV